MSSQRRNGLIEEWGLRFVSACVISVLFLSACERRTGTPTTTTETRAANAQSAPQSLSMGGAKSVTRFFVTSHGIGRGGDLGGLAGADARCQALAKAEGSGDHTWHAYLSATATKTTPAVNARDRIGKGPWYNAAGDRVAVDVGELHEGLSVTRDNAVTERGDPVNGDQTEVLTGSRPDGTAFSEADDRTCANWTSSGVGHAQVGRIGPTGDATATRAWNSARASRGCRQEDLQPTGGGLFYCFATD